MSKVFLNYCLQTKLSLKTLKSHYNLPTHLQCSVVTSSAPLLISFIIVVVSLLPSTTNCQFASVDHHCLHAYQPFEVRMLYWTFCGWFGWFLRFKGVMWFLIFVNNEFHNGLFYTYFLDPDDSSEIVHSKTIFPLTISCESNDTSGITHSTNVLRCHHCTADALSMLNHPSAVDDTHHHSKPLMSENTVATVHFHYISFYYSIALTYIKI